MNSRSKDEIRDIIRKDMLFIHNHGVELSNRLAEVLADNMSYVHELFTHLSQPSSGPLVAKTPKMLRKKVTQRIETILEDEVFQQENISPTSSLYSINEEERKENEVMGGRTKRGASKKAEDNIKKQSFILNDSAKKVKRESHIKRKKYNVSSSDEDNNENVSKYSKVEENITGIKGTTKRVTRKNSKQIVQPTIEKSKITEKAKEANEDNFELPILQYSSRRSSKSSENKEVNKVNDAIMPNIDDIEEPSMYEDAVGRPVPIMNSTLKHSLYMSEKGLNATVVLERLPNQPPKLNETVVIQKTINIKNSSSLKKTENVKNTLPNNTQPYKTPAQYDHNELLTDDESSPEVKRPKKQLNRKQPNKKETKDVLAISSEDETSNTPVKTFKNANVSTVTQESKTYKLNALFSPYAKESVKKRVEAFEQAVMHSPKSVDCTGAPTRITRTKTRAMATAEMQTETKTTEKNVAQILARKSLAKAKKISLARQKNNDELKENKEQLPERINKLLTQTDKPNLKMQQLKTTPLSKTKLMQPVLSLNCLYTPSNKLSNYSKVITASRTNIVTGVESFIQPSKTITTSNSVEKLEEKRRHEEDARKKKDEALRLQTEEKKRKRQEKELKNKLAREAKEKQELEKRQKAEKEREEKAKLALLNQERHREEAEKKRLAQLQRIQEKEERRKLEEQQRLQRLQEQEETERLLAEQRRREQEAERRREAEARAQQAAAEALKQKNQLLAAQAKNKQQTNNKYQGTVNYVLDSEPDDDESDDESKPKHEIPYWAQAHIRKAQLAMQQYIPERIVYKFFNTRKCTPDLTELFHGIDRNRLKRTSSAIWKTPPRISMMEPEFVERKLPLKN
ncbi:PREDICTED: inner centromere protein A-like isoform X1 [Trachymyrmex septentrionalis]|uniref:inner centromere protein A-like isoform X1 n=1 Tax=Trachymyrmex septentrionalis TaxID=34720 RepID=UPI00084EEF47|nr:PREDICTED: inner centromere protein A-like isoform X1 [Trachymyrmex septentrionalis]